MPRNTSFRVGRVTAYLRGCVWYLRYHEQGRRRQVRAARSRDAARQLAAEVNAQLEVGAPAATSFEPITLPELRRRWLDHHEHVRRSAVSTINRYRTATDHLLNFLEIEPVKLASNYRPTHAEAFVRHLRGLDVTPNGHPNTAKRRLRDKGTRFVLEVCRTMFNFALKRRHLPPYAENPFSVIEIDRIPIEDAKPIELLTAQQERDLLARCDDWQFPIFLTLMLTGMRPGELTHLLAPDDVDLHEGWLYVRNKADLGWQVKTRNERRIPIIPELNQVLRQHLQGRQTGPLFRRRRFPHGAVAGLQDATRQELQALLAERLEAAASDGDSSRTHRRQLCERLWREMGAIKPDRLRIEFMRLAASLGMPRVTAPKVLRHGFATCLQEANVDPLVRNELMGHVSAGAKGRGALAMTETYTHTRPETLRRQLETALAARPAVEYARHRLRGSRKSSAR